MWVRVAGGENASSSAALGQLYHRGAVLPKGGPAGFGMPVRKGDPRLGIA